MVASQITPGFANQLKEKFDFYSKCDGSWFFWGGGGREVVFCFNFIYFIRLHQVLVVETESFRCDMGTLSCHVRDLIP